MIVALPGHLLDAVFDTKISSELGKTRLYEAPGSGTLLTGKH